MIKIGTTVEISREPPYKEYGVYVGDIGVVTYVAKTGKYSVKIDGKKNPHYDEDRIYGEHGDFWIPKNCVKEYNGLNKEREEKEMNKLTGYNKVAVIEISGKEYFHALYDEDINVGDQVLVSGSMDKKFFEVKEIILSGELKERYSKDITSEVISKVDTSAYDKRVKNRIKAAELRKEMDKKIAEMDELNKYTMYAERNPELAKMLAEYNTLV